MSESSHPRPPGQVGLPDLADALTPQQAVERLRRDQRQRWLAGRPLPAEAYLERYAERLADADHAFALVWHEYQLRQEFGPAPSFAEYARLFPRFADRLRGLLGLSEEAASDGPSRLGNLLDGPATFHGAEDEPGRRREDCTERLALSDSGLVAQPASGAPPEQGRRPVVKWVANYEILGELGRGGMGVVYHALQHGLNRPVALKMVLAGAHADPDDLERFLKEAEAVAHLQHPNIVQVYEVGRHEGCPYFSMEYVDGGSLAKLIGGKPQSPRTSAELVEMLARAVHHAHGQGIVHRDLKPANVLLSLSRDAGPAPRLNEGMPKIVDFGLAKRLDSLDSQTRTGDIVGTPSYMAPEQARGDRGAVGPAVDVYGLGTVLYELLTGRAPFLGKTEMETVRKVLEEDPVPPARLNRMAPRDLSTVCLKCLHKQPSRRYASAFELGEDLRRFLAGEPIRARPVGVPERLWRWCRRRPAVAGLAAALLALFVGSFAGVTMLWLLAEGQRQEAEAAHQAEREQRQRAELQLYSSRIALADRELAAGEVAAAEALLAQCPPELRCWEWDYLERLCHADLLTLRGHAPWASGVAFAGDRLVSVGGDPYTLKSGQAFFWRQGPSGPEATDRWGSYPVALETSRDGRLAAAVDTDGRLRVWDAQTGRPHEPAPRLPDGERVGAVAFSPDGQTLAVGGDGVTLWSTATGRELIAFPDRHPGLASLAFSPDGKTLAGGKPSGPVWVWDAVTGRQTAALPAGAARLAFSPDGLRLAAASGSAVREWDAGTWQPRFVSDRHNGQVYAVAFSPDGLLLASGGVDQIVRVSDGRTGAEVVSFRGHAGAVRGLAFSPDGATLISAGQDGTLKAWDMTTPPGALVGGTPDLVNGEWVAALAIGPDGRRVLRVNQEAGRLDAFDVAADLASSSPPLDLFRDPLNTRQTCSFTADAGRFAGPAASDPCAVKVWDAAGREEAVLSGETLPVRCVCLSGDGRRLAVGHDRLRRVRDGGAPEGHVALWDVAARRRVRLGDDVRLARSLAFSPDGRRLAEVGFGAEGGKAVARPVRVWDVESGRVLLTAARPGTEEVGLSFSPDGRRVALADIEAGRLRVLKADPGEAGAGEDLFEPAKVAGSPAWTAFSPDGRRLAVVGHDGAVRLFDALTGQEVLTLRAPGETRPDDYGYSPRVAFSADGRWLACTTWDARVVVFDGDPHDEDDRPGQRLRLPAWRLRQARAALQAQDRFALEFHRRLLGELPADAGLLAEHGRLLAALGEWADAEAAIDRAAGLAPDDARLGYEQACLRLRRGDADGYRKACARLRADFGKTASPRAACWALQAWALADAPTDDAARADLERWAEVLRRAEDKKRGEWRPLGAASLRAGRCEEAVSCLESALADDPRSGDQALTCLLLALAQKRLGRDGDARASLAKAEAMIRRGEKTLPDDSFGLNPLRLEWTLWLAAQAWLEEARAQLAERKPE